MVNKVILVGPLTRDAESFEGARGPVTRMRMRTARSWQDVDGSWRDSTEHHNIVAFDRHAELCAVYALKDVRLYIEGHLRTRDYEGGDGLRRTATEVVVETVRVLGREVVADGTARCSDPQLVPPASVEG